MILVRRFMFLLALIFWQGGMMFYGGITVPVMRSKLSAKTEEPQRSAITQRVTQWLNLAGSVSLAIMAADIFLLPMHRFKRSLLWGSAMCLQFALVILHRRLSEMMADPGFYDSDMSHFAPWHSLYLIMSTIQWATMLALLAVSLLAWQKQDQRAGGIASDPTVIR
jgi:prolipoprotein diacylglyceryltransferase